MNWFNSLSPVIQTLLATIFTWGVTALGALVVCFFKEMNKKVLDTILGFSAGVMIASSFWSLLSPALDLSLELGRIRFRANGSDGGHNGIKSVIQHLGTKDVARLKIGIGPQPNIPSEVFVLQNFSKEELDNLKGALTKAKEGIGYYFKEGMAAAQNKYN